MKLEANSIREYIALVPERRRAAIELTGRRTLALSPGSAATFQHGMPFYTLAGKPYIAVASQRRHLSLYIVGLDTLLADRADLRTVVDGIDRGRNCLRFSDKLLARVTPELLDPLIRAAHERCASTYDEGPPRS